MRLILVCGLKREAALFARAGGTVHTVAGGGDGARLERELDAAAEAGVPLLSFGVAGALTPSLRPGAIVVDGDPAMAALLHAALPKADRGLVTGSDRIVGSRDAKAVLAARTGALAVDMETHIARRVAARHRLPFGVVRAISDGCDESLPPAALVGMRPDGGIALGAVLLSLVRKPAQLPALMRTGRQATLAFRALDEAADALRRSGFAGISSAA